MNLSRKIFFIGQVLFLVTMARTNAQIKIIGSIINSKNEPVASASIHIKESGIGVMTDSAGRFSINSDAKGKIILQVSSAGYDSWETEINPSDSIIQLDIKLQNESKTLGEVIVISAGSLEASDKAKGASLTPIDAVTVAGNGGDIANALRALPGAQVIGEQEGLFVRGGTNEETKQFIDGGLMRNPNFSPVPGLPQPARLNPFLFKGILFSTGDYSGGPALIHKTYIEVDENGTQAAAVTSVGITEYTDMPSPLLVDINHPFVYIIQEKTSGSILFIGLLNDPSLG